MRVKVHFFAVLADRMGERQQTVQIEDGTTVEQLYRRLFESDMRGLSVMFAVNQEYVVGGHILADGDEVAFIPPLGGG